MMRRIKRYLSALILAAVIVLAAMVRWAPGRLVEIIRWMEDLK